MRNVISTTIDEIDQIEKQYSQKNKHRQSWNLRNRIGDKEKVLFCYYEIVSGDIIVYILTDIKLIINQFNISNYVHEIKLNEVFHISPKPTGLLSSGGVQVNGHNFSITLFEGIKDNGFLQNISGIVQKAKANLDVRMRSSTININAPETQSQDTIAEQFVKLADLHKTGVLTDDEFTRAKEKVLSKK